MPSKCRKDHEDAWRNAKKICQLNARQVEMARALGMNPKKLPRLRPSPQQRWKLPVGEFIEACYRKRFGGNPFDHHLHSSEQDSCERLAPQQKMATPKRISEANSQVEDLICYLINLADDLEAWLAQRAVAPNVLPQVTQELRDIAAALETGAPISPIPTIPQCPPVGHASPRRGDWEHMSDHDVPF